MYKLKVSKATLQDVFQIERNLRSADRAELEAVSGLPALKTLVQGFGEGKTWVFKADGVQVALFGVVPYTKYVGVPWMVATNDLVKHKRFFLKHCKKYIDHMLHLYPEGLVNYIDLRNEVHIRFIQHFGFRIDGLHAYGVEKLPFLLFSMNLKGPS